MASLKNQHDETDFGKPGQVEMVTRYRPKREDVFWEVDLPDGLGVAGVIRSDQIKNLDGRAKNSQFKCKAPRLIIETAIAKLDTLISD